MRLLFLFIAILFTIDLSAQMLDNTIGQVFEDRPFFSKEFVRKNKIKCLKGRYSTKSEMDVIRPNSDVYVYDFDKKGRLSREYKTAHKDTIVTLYEYDEKDNLILKRQSDQYGYHAYSYKYDNKRRVVEQEYRRDSNKSGDKINFQLNESFIITTEKFGYLDLSDSTYKKIYYNSADREYKTEFFYFDSDGYLKKQEGRLKNGAGSTKIRYAYDEKGRISTKQTEVLLTRKNVSKWEYEYDSFGNILALRYYRNGSWITEYQLLYNKKTMLLKGIITRDHATNFMMILQFKEVQFYSKN